MKFLKPRDIYTESYSDRAKYFMAYRLTLVFNLLFLGLFTFYIRQDVYSGIAYACAFLVACGALIFLVATRRYRPTFMLYAIAGTVIAHFGCNFSLTTPHYVDFLWMIVTSFLAFIGLGNRWGLGILSVNVVGIFYFIFFSHNAHILVIKPFNPVDALLAYIEIVTAFFIIAYIMYQFIRIQNYSEARLRKANTELALQNSIIRSKSDENVVLLKEIHHRVKNNLQIIISLLRLQREEIQSTESRDQFTEAINRVMVMSSIHQRLYREKEMARVDLTGYLTDLANDLKIIFENHKNILVNIRCTYTEIDLKTVVPLGLLLNELISNSYKYAFRDFESGSININVTEKGDLFELKYSDSGTWLERSEGDSGFGLDLIQILTEQLNGNFEFHSDNTGTHYLFKLSKLA